MPKPALLCSTAIDSVVVELWKRRVTLSRIGPVSVILLPEDRHVGRVARVDLGLGIDPGAPHC